MTSPSDAVVSWPMIEAGVIVALIVAVIVGIVAWGLRRLWKDVLHQVAKANAELVKANSQLVKNGGSSLRDVGDRTELAVAELVKTVSGQGLDIAIVKTRLDDHIAISNTHNAAVVAQAAAAALIAHDERASDTRKIMAGQTP